MTRDEAAKLLPIIQAYAEGKVIQVRDIHGVWSDRPSPMFSSEPGQYRIRPEPLIVEGWINVYPKDLVGCVITGAYETREEAERVANVHRLACLHIRQEVERL